MIAFTSFSLRPRRRRRSSPVRFSPGPQGRTNTTAEPRFWIWLAMDWLRPATIELMPVTVMMPMTTPRMVSPARSLYARMAARPMPMASHIADSVERGGWS